MIFLYFFMLFFHAIPRNARQQTRENFFPVDNRLSSFRSEIIHASYGVSFEPENLVLQYQSPTTIEFTLPLTVKVGKGPFQAQALSRVHRILERTLKADGLDVFHLNKTETDLHCHVNPECKPGWMKLKLGMKVMSKFFKQLIFKDPGRDVFITMSSQLQLFMKLRTTVRRMVAHLSNLIPKASLISHTT